MTTPIITVAICTLNRAEVLKDCLGGVLRQTIPHAQYQVIVVDNGSTDATKEMVESLGRDFQNLRYVQEPVTGLSKARNTALAQTTTRYIAYTDDDAIPYEDWLEELLKPFSLGVRPAVVGGELDPVWEVPRPDWLADEFLHKYSVCLNWDSEPRPILDREWLCEANIAFEAQTLTEAGGFCEHLGRRGPLLLSGENFVNEIIRESGRCLYYTPQARVWHRIPKNRLNPDWLRQRSFWGGVTNSVIMSEAVRLFGAKTAWVDLALPSTHNDWASMMNPEPDAHLQEHVAWMYNLGWLLHRKGLIAA
jgi:glycosyltransferase involved in cell wall biosynthesis